jgi:hypothetical protein
MPFGTGAGKGDLPRPVDGNKYRDNYERAFGKRNQPTDIELPDIESNSGGSKGVLHRPELLDAVSGQADESGTTPTAG